VATKPQRIAGLAQQRPDVRGTSLPHSRDVAWFHAASRRLRQDRAPGDDRQTVAAYGQEREPNRPSLRERANSGPSVAPPVRRGSSPTGTGPDPRPRGRPTTEDQVLQRAVALLLAPIAAQACRDGSSGGRPGRAAHGALRALWSQGRTGGGQWLLDLDSAKCFATLAPAHLRTFLPHRGREGGRTRLLDKWLQAGGLAPNVWSSPATGLPQGGALAPLLRNLSLHDGLDQWVAQEVTPRLRGRAFLLRFADDAGMGCESREEAERVCRVLPQRCGQSGLTLPPEKTRLGACGRPRGATGATPGPLDFLGFPHDWSTSRRGTWLVKTTTACQRWSRGLTRSAEWCRRNRHRPVAAQPQELCQQLQGPSAYDGITGHGRWVQQLKQGGRRLWQTWLHRRSRPSADMPWDRYVRLLERSRFPPISIVPSVSAAKP
jgi:RNA-directed DNA polymerase